MGGYDSDGIFARLRVAYGNVLLDAKPEDSLLPMFGSIWIFPKVLARYNMFFDLEPCHL